MNFDKSSMIKDKLQATPLRKVKKQYLCGVPSVVEKNHRKIL